MVYLIGAGGHAGVIIEILEEQDMYVGAIKDANTESASLFDCEIYKELPEAFNEKNDRIIISIGDNAERKKAALACDFMYTCAIHRCACISKRATIGEGSVVMPGVTINTCVEIGDHAIINTNASIDHDCILENFVHIAQNAVLGGNVKIGEGTHVGIGAIVADGVSIGKWCKIGPGAVIREDVTDGAVIPSLSKS